MKKAFTLIELLIVVAILGIMAAIVMPLFAGQIQLAKEAAAKDNLRVLREAIERYASDNNDIPPGYHLGDPANGVRSPAFTKQIVTETKYISDLPENPFNGLTLMAMVNDGEEFPTDPADTVYYGWIYQPQTKNIRLNWPGTDSEGRAYLDY